MFAAFLKNKMFLRAAVSVLAVGTAGSAEAGPLNLVTNGGFETTNMTSYCPTGQTSNCADQMTTSNVTGWSTTGYNFIYNASSVRTSSAVKNGITVPVGDPLAYQTGGGQVGLWNPSAPASYTGQYKTIFSDPAGGNLAAADGAYQVGAISQTLNGLTKGSNYAVNFWFAGAQQDGYAGATTEAWKVSLGSQSFTTAVLNNNAEGFTGWFQQTFIFQATGASEVLSFLAIGTPTGQPPFTLLDGVSAFDVPEPGTLAMLGAGVLGLGVVARRRGKRA